ncbi:hypothetical protein ACKU5B_028020 [Klebsiella pneumoniae]
MYSGCYRDFSYDGVASGDRFARASMAVEVVALNRLRLVSTEAAG